MTTFLLTSLKKCPSHYQNDYTRLITERLAKVETVVTFHLSDGSDVKGKSFKEAVKHERLSEKYVLSFEAKLEIGDVGATIDCGGWAKKLAIRVSPSTYGPARDELFIPLREWASRIRPPRWQQIWRSYGELSFFIWVVVFLIALSISDSLKQDASYFKQQGNELLNNGVKTPEDQRRALEILLSLQSDHIAPIPHSSSSKRFLVFAIGSFLVMLIASFPPRMVIGVGRGKQKLSLWRWWVKFVSITVPGFFITTFFFPYLTALIRKLVL